MKDNKKTIIRGIILFMLVAIIGTTYAYFAANITGNESTSTIVVTGGRMEIVYDNLSGTIEAYDIYPRNDAWVTKNFTVTGNNSTTKDMKYKVGLSVDNNTFSKGALTYKVTATNTSNMGDVISITDDAGELAVDNAEMIMAYGDPLLAIGYFPKGEDMVHTYTFELFFKDTGENQNIDQGASFAGHITIEEYPFNEIGLNQENFGEVLSAVYTESDMMDMITSGNLIIPSKFNMADEWYEIVQVDTNTFDGISELGINSITLNEGLRLIKNSADTNLTGITNVNIPSTVTYIGENSFMGANLSNLTLPNNIKYIGTQAFALNSNLTGTLNIPNSVTYIGDGAFYGTGITSANVPQNIEYLSGFTGTGISGHLTTPSTTKTIGNYAFNHTNITGLTLNEGLESIGDWAFSPMLPDFSSISSSTITGHLTIPSTVKTIGEFAFGMTGITGLTLNEGLESIGKDSFARTTNLTGTITIPSTVKTIEDEAFSESGITGLTLNEGLESIERYAFYEASHLTGTITIPSTVKTIGNEAFKFTIITGLTLNEGLESIGGSAFSSNPNLTGHITIPSTVKTIGVDAFAATGITGLTLNEGLESIGEYAFSNATNLTGNITIPVSIKSIDMLAFNGTGITEVNYPGSETEWNQINIGSYAFPSGVTINYNYTGA